MPESNTPIGLLANEDSLSSITLIPPANRNRGRMDFGAKRLGNRTCVWRQIRFCHGEVRALRPVIHGGVVILNPLRDRGPESLPIRARRDPLPFRRVADKAA